MITHVPANSLQVDEKEWVGFPGGELEGKRPKALCSSCRARLRHAVLAPSRVGQTRLGPSRARPLCFQCYRAELDRERALLAAGHVDTASAERFQTALPFEPVNVARLERLRVERVTARAELQAGAERYEDRVRRAQIAARRALQGIASGFEGRCATDRTRDIEQHRAAILAAAAHAAELQLPEAWLPFVVSR